MSEFNKWYERVEHVPHLQPWQEHRVKILAKKAFKKGKESSAIERFERERGELRAKIIFKNTDIAIAERERDEALASKEVIYNNRAEIYDALGQAHGDIDDLKKTISEERKKYVVLEQKFFVQQNERDEALIVAIALDKDNDRLRKAIEDAINELGVLIPGYPAPVANAAHLLRDALEVKYDITS